MKLFTGVGLGWLARRVPDWGGWILTFGGAALALYNSMPPAQQATVQRIFSGHWQDVTLGSAFGLVMLAFATWRSFHATTRPQIVTENGNKVTKDAAAAQNPVAVNSAMKAADNAVADKSARPDGPLIGMFKKVFGK